MWAPEAESGGGDSVPDPLLARLRDSVAASLEQKGFRFAEAAPVILSVGVAERPGRVALVGEDGAALSAAQGQKGIGRCRKERLTRVAISMADSGTGQMLYRGSAQEAHCRATLDLLLPHLVESALADLAAPAGERVATSPIRN